MKPHSYFENILKHKRYFNNKEITLMTPKQATAYRITELQNYIGHIRRSLLPKEIKEFQNFSHKFLAHFYDPEYVDLLFKEDLAGIIRWFQTNKIKEVITKNNDPFNFFFY